MRSRTRWPSKTSSTARSRSSSSTATPPASPSTGRTTTTSPAPSTWSDGFGGWIENLFDGWPKPSESRLLLLRRGNKADVNQAGGHRFRRKPKPPPPSPSNEEDRLPVGSCSLFDSKGETHDETIIRLSNQASPAI